MVRSEQPAKKDDSRIVLPDEIAERMNAYSMVGIVEQIGEGCYKNHPSLGASTDVPKVGDRVLFQRYSGLDRMINGIKYKFLRDDNIIAIIDPEDDISN